MDPEAVFLAGYALLLTALAAGLGWVGRRNTEPWSSRMLAAGRRLGEAGPDAEHEPGWPHNEVPAFHVVVGIVALAAALLLDLVSLVRHHRPVEFVVQAAVLVLVASRLAHLARRYRPPQAGGC
ncbi:MAG: hypothetical protein QOG43_525 [Actinomycetota bacterium]|nr:hypothetical protein [Actinomycetota bacterium]